MKKGFYLLVGIITIVVLQGCNKVNQLEENWDNIASTFKGRSVTIQTYDEKSQLVDQVKGSNIEIKRKIAIDSSLSTNDYSNMMISLDEHKVSHVDSPLILYEDGLYDVMNKKDLRLKITNYEAGTPIINEIIHENRSYFRKDTRKVIVISQNGSPLAIYAGKYLSEFKTNIPTSTGFKIDGKYLFVYSCEYTIYDMALLQNKK